jgi:hypothetical protein
VPWSEAKAKYYLLSLLGALVMAGGLLVVVPSARAQQDGPVGSVAGPSAPAPSSASQAQSPSDPSCATAQQQGITGFFCLEKTANPNPVNVGEPLTFTIRAFCFAVPANVPCDIFPDMPFEKGSTVTDTLPPNVRFVSASASGAFAPVTCTESAGTVTCAPETYCKGRLLGIGCPEGTEEIPYVETITVIPTQCGTFTNAVIDSPQQLLVGGGPASAAFTVNCPPPPNQQQQQQPVVAAPVTQDPSQSSQSGDASQTINVIP